MRVVDPAGKRREEEEDEKVQKLLTWPFVLRIAV